MGTPPPPAASESSYYGVTYALAWVVLGYLVVKFIGLIRKLIRNQVPPGDDVRDQEEQVRQDLEDGVRR